MKSNLTKVTFTGADDTIDPARLIALVASYLRDATQVEWGILIGSQSGHRFPSEQWIKSLLRMAGPKVNLSLHICGQHLKNIAAGKPLDVPFDLAPFQRCQLNWHGDPMGNISNEIYRSFSRMESSWTPQVIFQLDGQNNELMRACGLKNVAGLVDHSHGRGISPSEWARLSNFSDDAPVGFAGGLGPENLREELPKIHAAAVGEYWIDMETRLFEGRLFSLPKCVEVVEIVNEFNTSI